MAGLVRGILYSSWRGFFFSLSLYLTSVYLSSTSRKSGKQLDSLYPFMMLTYAAFFQLQSVTNVRFLPQVL